MAPEFDDTIGLVDETNIDNTVAVGDETNVDDTCFSTFSVIPEMTLFAKLGDADRKSPLKDRHMVCSLAESALSMDIQLTCSDRITQSRAHHDPTENDPALRDLPHLHLAA